MIEIKVNEISIHVREPEKQCECEFNIEGYELSVKVRVCEDENIREPSHLAAPCVGYHGECY